MSEQQKQPIKLDLAHKTPGIVKEDAKGRKEVLVAYSPGFVRELKNKGV